MLPYELLIGLRYTRAGRYAKTAAVQRLTGSAAIAKSLHLLYFGPRHRWNRTWCGCLNCGALGHERISKRSPRPNAGCFIPHLGDSAWPRLGQRFPRLAGAAQAQRGRGRCPLCRRTGHDLEGRTDEGGDGSRD